MRHGDGCHAHGGAGVQCAPARAEHRGFVDRHRAGRDQQRVQARHHGVGTILVEQCFIDHKREIQVVRRLRDQVHALAPELSPDVAEFVQQRAHAATDQGDCRAGRNDLDAADFGKVRAQGFEHVRIDQVVGRIERDGDVGLRRADQVHRQAMALETLEGVGEETDLLPHADGFHRHQHDAAPRADRLDAGHGRRVARDRGPVHRRMHGVEDADWHIRVAAWMDAARVQHLRAGGRDFLRLLEVQPREQARVGNFARIRAEHAGHVGPDLHALRTEQRAEIRRGRIRAAVVRGRRRYRRRHAAR